MIMKSAVIKGENYQGFYNNVRIACRGIIIEDGKILTSYESVNNVYMLPGGGLEKGETKRKCCRRELKEETGYLVKPLKCALKIIEYYGDYKYVTYYYSCKICGKDLTSLTEQEKEVGLEPKWVEACELIDIFSKYEQIKEKNIMCSGTYLKEYTALLNVLGK